MANTDLQSKFNFNELETIRNNFLVGDKNKDQLLDVKEFTAIMSSSQLDEQDTVALFSLFDKDHSGKVSFYEFLSCLAILTKGSATEKLEFIFKFYDFNGDGVLATDEITTLIKHIARVAENYAGVGKAEIAAQAIAKRMDTDEDGKISLKEWIQFGSENPELLKVFGL